MTTAIDLRKEFIDEMEKVGFKYTVLDEEDNIVRLGFGASSYKEGGGARTEVYVDFDENTSNDSYTAHFVVQHFAKCPLANVPKLLVKLNEYNAQYRWVKVWMKQDGDDWFLTCDTDARLTPGDVGPECIKTAVTLSDITEDIILDLGDLVEPQDEATKLMEMLEALKGLLG